MNTQVIAPLGFFTYDAFRAGWYFLWRLFVYTLPAFALIVIGGAMAFVPLFAAGWKPGMEPPLPDTVTDMFSSGRFIVGVILIVLGWLGMVIASIPLTSKIARTWGERTWGRTFAGGVWWSIFWRVFLINLLASIIGKGVNVVIEQLTTDTAGVGSNLVGLFLSLVVASLNIVVTLLSYGWAMSRVVASRLGGMGVATAVVAALNPLGYTPTMGPQHSAPLTPMAGRPPVTPAATAPVMAPRAPAPPPSSGGTTAGRRQCPQCNLYETEKGSVLGWYCKVCGWRESGA